MRYEVREIKDKKIWEDFSLNSHPNSFLQSWNWGEFNWQLGRRIWRFGVYKEGKLVAINSAIKHETRLGNYFYCPRGPVFDWKDLKVFDSLLSKLKEVAKEERCVFIKFDPLLEDMPKNRKIFKDRGFKSAVTFVQVEDAWLLALDRTEEELLANMRKTTRYLVRHEPKQGIQIEQSARLEDCQKFVDLLYSTANRKGFVNHPKQYYLKQFEILSKDKQERIFIARKSGEVLSMAMIAFYGDMGNYLHAASNPKQESVGYLLQWEAIKEAKKRGCKYYNFWGVVKDKNFHPRHPWYGFSLFKRGFGGFKLSYIRAQDLPLNRQYFLYRLAERGRRLLRRIQSGYWED